MVNGYGFFWIPAYTAATGKFLSLERASSVKIQKFSQAGGNKVSSEW